MLNRTQVPAKCECGKDLTFIASWTFRGLWGFTDVRTYECAEHGPVFFGPQTVVGRAAEPSGTHPPNGDRDSLVVAPRNPRPPLRSDAVAAPEPD
jgi:hypothetical protein